MTALTVRSSRLGAEAFLTGVGHRLHEHHDPHDLDLSLREPNGGF